MTYKTRLRVKGKNESPFAHAIKLCWFILQFEDVRHKYSLEKVCNEFEDVVKSMSILEILQEDYGIEWDFFQDDNSMCTPDYDLVKGTWVKKYEWREQYPIFKSDRLMSSDQTELEKYIRQKAYFNRKDSELMETCYDKEKDFKVAEDDGKDMTYYRNKNNETISTTEERWRKRLGLDKEDNTKEVEPIPIPDNPEHEDQTIRDIWTERARSDVIPR
jgi:hypothetical protein